MHKNTLTNINKQLYFSKYEWIEYNAQKNEDMKYETKIITGIIEINNREYDIIAYFRNKNYGYDLYVKDIRQNITYNFNRFQSYKTKKLIVKELWIFFDKPMEER